MIESEIVIEGDWGLVAVEQCLYLKYDEVNEGQKEYLLMLGVIDDQKTVEVWNMMKDMSRKSMMKMT